MQEIIVTTETKRRIFMGLLVVALVVIAFGWYIGTVQGMLQGILASPGICALLLVMVQLPLMARTKARGRQPKFWPLAASLVLLLIASVSYPFRASSWASGIEAELHREDSLQNQHFIPTRILPREVALAYARRAQTDSRYEVGQLQPTLTPSRQLVWQSALTPGSFTVKFTAGVLPVVQVRADTTDAVVTITDPGIPSGGEGNWHNFARIIHWTRPFDQVTDPVYDVAHHVALLPLLRNVLGKLHYVGVAVFDSTGSHHVISPETAAKEFPYLRLYPEELVRWKAEIWAKWRAGPFGFISKNGLYSVAEIGNNPAPTLIDDESRALWVVPMEPTSGGSFGLSALVVVDAVSGEMKWWNTANAGFMSPSRAQQVAISDPAVAAYKASHPLEPKLAIVRGHVFWIIPVAPENSSSVQAIVLVDAAGGVSLVTRSWTEARDFLQRGVACTPMPECAGGAVPVAGTVVPGSREDKLKAIRHLVDSLQKLLRTVDSAR